MAQTRIGSGRVGLEMWCFNSNDVVAFCIHVNIIRQGRISTSRFAVSDLLQDSPLKRVRQKCIHADRGRGTLLPWTSTLPLPQLLSKVEWLPDFVWLIRWFYCGTNTFIYGLDLQVSWHSKLILLDIVHGWRLRYMIWWLYTWSWLLSCSVYSPMLNGPWMLLIKTSRLHGTGYRKPKFIAVEVSIQEFESFIVNLLVSRLVYFLNCTQSERASDFQAWYFRLRYLCQRRAFWGLVDNQFHFIENSVENSSGVDRVFIIRFWRAAFQIAAPKF